jgi:hypothetical protein
MQTSQFQTVELSINNVQISQRQYAAEEYTHNKAINIVVFQRTTATTLNVECDATKSTTQKVQQILAALAAPATFGRSV